MRTKLLLPLVALAILATALSASAQAPIDAKAEMVLDRSFLTQEGTHPAIGWLGTLKISGSGDLDGTYDFIMEVPVGGTFPPADTVDLRVEPAEVEPPEAVRPRDLLPPGPRWL